MGSVTRRDLRKWAEPKVHIAVANAYVDIENPWGYPIHFGLVPVALEQAHGLLDTGPIVNTGAIKASEDREVGWLITVAGFIPEDAAEAVDAALTELRTDIFAGRTAPGTHRGFRGRDLLEPKEEILRAYRDQVLRELMGW